jgi:DNA polymerase elongation subunit (family B)
MYQNLFITSRTEFSESTVYLWDDAKGLIISPYKELFGYAYRRSPKGTFTSIYGDKLMKISRFKPDDPELFESDLSRETRVLTDLYLDSDMPSTGHRIMCIDIEVDSTGGFAKPESAENEITAISLYDYTLDHYTVFLLDKTQEFETQTHGNETVESCDTEFDLITKFLNWYQAFNPTIITGWNIDGYDIPYLYNRLKRVRGASAANSLSTVGLVKYNERRERYSIAGVSCLDYLVLYKKFIGKMQPSYRLDAIGKTEIGLGKIEYEGSLDQLFKNDLGKFLDYTLNDVKIVVGIDQKLKYIDLARFICHLGHVPYEDFSYSSKFIEGTIVTYLHRKGIIPNNKPVDGKAQMDAKLESDEEGFTGAHVRIPMPGLYDWIYSLDLTSLYPSIIMSLNISPDSKFGRMYNWDVDKHVRKEIEPYEIQIGGNAVERVSRAQFVNYIRTHQLAISSNGILYSTKKVGIIPEILDKWFKDRVEFKNLMKKYVKEGNKEQEDFYDRRQYVQKILLNSIYGVLGLPIFRFYDLDNAAAVTLTGQDVIKTTAKFVNNQYKALGAEPKTEQEVNAYWAVMKAVHKKEKKPEPPRPHPEDHCVYIDTDSVYFSATPVMRGGDPVKYTIELANEMETKINIFYDTMAKMLFNCDRHRFQIKGESVAQTGLWVAKKRYALKRVYNLETNEVEDGKKPKVTGLDTKRSSFPPAFSKFMEGLIMDFLNKTPKEEVDKKILDFQTQVRGMPYLTVARNTSINNLWKFEDPSVTDLTIFPKGATAHAKAAIVYNRMLRNNGWDSKYGVIVNGDKIKYVYLKKNPHRLETMAVKGYDDPPEIVALIEKYIDYDKLFKKELANKLENFYSALGWGRLPTEINQLSMDFFDFQVISS